MIKLDVNGRKVTVTVPGDTPLLWVLREELGLTGTKYGCGTAQGGARAVHLHGGAVRSCVTPVAAAQGKKIVTIEGLGAKGLHPVQKAWIEEDVVQCGYCQPGHIMTAAALLHSHPHPSDAEIDKAMEGLICRCGTYERVRKAIHSAAAMPKEGGAK